MNSQILDGFVSAQQSCDQVDDNFEKGIVLDSDDEGENPNEPVRSVNECLGETGRLSGRGGIGLLRRQRAPAGCFRRLNKTKKHVLRRLDSAISGGESSAGRADLCNDHRVQEHCVIMDSVVSRSSEQNSVLMNSVNPEYLEMEGDNLKFSHESKSLDLGKDINYDCKRAELNNFESPQFAESQDRALQFVENYISVCDLSSNKDIPARKTDKLIKSPPCLRSKGAQCLARRLTLGSTASKLTTFDWSEKHIADESEYASKRLYKDSVFGCRGNKSGRVSVNPESPNVELYNDISCLQSEERLSVNMSSPKDSDTLFLSSIDTEKVGLTFVMHESMELKEQFDDAGISRQKVENDEPLRLPPDELGIGLDTQMAAEAMEELVNSGTVDACFDNQGSNNKVLESSNVLSDRSKSIVDSQEVAFVDWKRKEKRSKTRKISTVPDKSLCRVAAKRFKNQQGSFSQSVVGKNLMTKKLMAEELFNKRTESTINRKTAAPSRITMQQEDCGITERYGSKGVQNLARVCSRGSKETAGGIKYDPPVKEKMITSKRTCLKSKSRSSFQVETHAAKGKENFYVDVVDMDAKLNPWVYPKGKRTLRRTPHAISSSKPPFGFPAIDDNLKKNSIEEAVGRVANLIVYKRRRKVSSGSEHAGSSLKSAVGLSSSVTVQVLERSAKRKRLYSSPLLRSPLINELTRLGHPNSLPDFLPKESRRRRAMEKVCILFSQNLETNTLKQQTKIVARLGFSIASCSSDATHFIADRFVRTRNMLEAIALGKHVVTHLWLESCEQAGYRIDEKSYILRDEKKEKQIGFNMHVSLAHATQIPLLKGRRVLITPNVKPGVDVISSLIKAVQGEVVQNILNANTKDKLIHNDILILSSIEDYAICSPFVQRGVSIYDSELLLNGIVTQRLEYERYRLFKDGSGEGE